MSRQKSKRKTLSFILDLKDTHKKKKASITQSPNHRIQNNSTNQPARNVSDMSGLLRSFQQGDKNTNCGSPRFLGTD